MSNRRKSPQDMSPSYLEKLSWFKMKKELVRMVCSRPRLRNPAKIAFFGLQPYFHDGAGMLLEPLEHVAKDLGYKTTSKLGEDVEELVEVGFLRRTKNGTLYDPVSYKLITGQGEPSDAEFCRISQELAKIGENLHSSPGETSRVEESRVFSREPKGSPTKNETSTTHSGSDSDPATDQKNGVESLTLPAPFFGLTFSDLETVRDQFPSHDLPKVYQKFVDYHTSKGNKKVTRAQLVGWFKRENLSKSGQAEQQAATKASGSPEDEEIRRARLPRLDQIEVEDKKTGYTTYSYTLGNKPLDKCGISACDFLRLVKNMSLRSPEQAHKYLYKLVGFEWNYQDAISLDLIVEYEAGDDEKLVWEGVSYESEQDKASRLERKRAEEQIRIERQAADKEELKSMEDLYNTDEHWFKNIIIRAHPRDDLRLMPKFSGMPEVAQWIKENVILDVQAKRAGDIRMRPKDGDHAWRIANKAIEVGLIVDNGEFYIGCGTRV